MAGGTGRIGLTSWGTTRPSSGFWGRFYLRPLPHQHRSFERNTVVEVVVLAMPPGYASRRMARRARPALEPASGDHLTWWANLHPSWLPARHSAQISARLCRMTPQEVVSPRT